MTNMLSRSHFWAVAAAGIALLCLVLLAGGGRAQEDEAVLASLRDRLIPTHGTQTSYGIPLDLRNMGQFIDWYYSIELTTAKRAIKDEALRALVAPCCDDNSAATCCCECNLSRSVWGLSGYLIREKGYGVEAVREAAYEWLRFARPDYYLAAALQEEGIDPQKFGLTTYGSCYRGICDLPVTEGGCAGMTDLVEPDPERLPPATSPEENGSVEDEGAVVASPAYGLIGPIDALALIEARQDDPSFVILDVRTSGEFAAGYIAGAIQLNFYDREFEEHLAQLDRDSTYLVYCRSGNRSRRATNLMQELGFCCVYDLEGGF